MSDRRYTDEEAAAIFARASEMESEAPRALSGSQGLTLGELQAIGREAGIAPESVALAARGLDQSRQPPTMRFLGLPLGVARTVTLDRRLTDEEWERLVVLLRDTFDARGTVRTDGAFRQWTNGNLQVLVEPAGGGQRIRMRTVKGAARGYLMGGLGLVGIASAVSLASVLTGTRGVAEVVAVVAPLFLIGGGLFGLGALRLPGWARLRRRQMEEVAGRLAMPPADAAERKATDHGS